MMKMGRTARFEACSGESTRRLEIRFRALSARTRYLGRSVTVSDAAHRLDATGVAAKLLADPADNGVDDIAASRFTVAPDLVEELGASDGVALVENQML